MSSSTFLGTGTCLGSLPLFWAWISALRTAALLEVFPYSMLSFCAFNISILAVVLVDLCTDVVVFSCTEVVFEDDMDTDLAAELEAVKAASYLAEVLADALLSFESANWRP